MILIISILLIALVGSTSGDQANNSYTYTFSIKQTPLPPLFYTDLTYIVHLGQVGTPSASVNGLPVNSSNYDPATGDFIFSSDQIGKAEISFTSDNPPEPITLEKAALKENKAWAWSHGMDDNVNLQEQINAITAKGWRATLFMIGEAVEEERQEEWIVDQPGLVALINQGWNIGNHTWSHACYSDQTEEEILDGQAVVERAIQASDHPDHVAISFASPCFDTEYVPLFDALRNGRTTLLVNELGSGSPELMNVDGSDVSMGERTAIGVTSANYQLGRDGSIESDTSATEVFDWMAANAGPGKHFWFNTFTHGDNEERLRTVLDYAYTTYGPDGTNELWMAPEDEIYSYLLVRDSTTITDGSLHSALTDTPANLFWAFIKP